VNQGCPSGRFGLAAGPPAAGRQWALPHRPTSPSKTRVGGFSRRPSGRLSRRSCLRPIPTPGCRAYGYKTAAGRLQWPNRDPIGEKGGINLYQYARNNAVTQIDPFGLAHGNPVSGPNGAVGPSDGYRPGGVFYRPPPPPETPWGCAERIANEVGRLPGKPNDPSSRYNHCLASCRISRECLGGRFSAWIAGDWYQDPWWQDMERHNSDPGDRMANKVGRDASKCKSKSCEAQCNDALKNGRLY
jgi:uncharacterized protein RhaS with RHS repeats